LGIGSSIANGGLNTARIVLTAMSCQPNNTWNQLGSNIDWANEKIQTNLVTDLNTYQTFSTFADAGQMAWGAGGLYKMFKGGIGLPSFSNSPSFMDAGTGMRISGVPDDFGRMNVSPINGVDRGSAGVSRVNPEKVVNAISDFKSIKWTFENENFMLDKKGMKHILERHHPEYWDGSVKATQTFLDRNLSIDDITNIADEVLKQNRSTLIQKGTTGMYPVEGTVNGVDYVVGLNKGRVGQLYKK
jgi:hypothetical protein